MRESQVEQCNPIRGGAIPAWCIRSSVPVLILEVMRDRSMLRGGRTGVDVLVVLVLCLSKRLLILERGAKTPKDKKYIYLKKNELCAIQNNSKSTADRWNGWGSALIYGCWTAKRRHTVFDSAGEILNPCDWAVVLPFWSVQLHSGPEASRKLSAATESQSSNLETHTPPQRAKINKLGEPNNSCSERTGHRTERCVVFLHHAKWQGQKPNSKMFWWI